MPEPIRITHPTAGAAPGGFTFWWLLLLGFSTLAPCVLLPEWREYQSITVAEQVETQRADTMAALVQEKRRSLDRLQRDPAVVVRLAQRELHYGRSDQYAVAVAAGTHEVLPIIVPSDVLAAVEPADPILVDPPALPTWVASWSRWLPPFNYDGVFCDDHIRPIVMTMSIALIGLSFWLYGRRAEASAS